MSFWRQMPHAIEVRVRATPKGGRDEVEGIATLSDGRDVLKIRVKALAQEGAATAAVIHVLARAAGVAPSRIRLVSGATARVKTFHIDHAPTEGAGLIHALTCSLKGRR